jgi:hypothetical protein
MALTRCRECGDTVSTKATSCPHCGASFKANKKTILVWPYLITFTVLGALFLSALVFKSPKDDTSSSIQQTFTCEQGRPANGNVVDVTGSGHTLYMAPDTTAPAVFNKKATRIFGEPQYHQIDSSTRVQIQCEKGDWVKAQLTEPKWLTDVQGWTKREYLLPPRAFGEARTFSAQDIYWYDSTSKYKETIVRAVNRIQREDPRCKKHIDPASVFLSSVKSRPGKPVFFVTCGAGAKAVNVYFTPADVESPKPFRAPVHIDHARAINLCEAYATNHSVHPSTVKFSRFFDLTVVDTPNGNTTVRSTFTAKNSFNLELAFNIRCRSK